MVVNLKEIALSIVLPCYNEEKNIPDILKRFSEIISSSDIEVVLVNNGSVDNTEQMIKNEISRNSYTFARIARVEKNIGYGFGVITGLRSAKGEFIGFTHADLQCDPLDVVRAYDILRNSKDPEKSLVKGKRIGRNSLISNILLYLTSILFINKFSDINAQPKVFHRSFLSKLKSPPNDFTLDLYVQYVALKNKMNVFEIPVEFPERKHGKSNWSSTFRSRFKAMVCFVVYIFKLRIFGD